MKKNSFPSYLQTNSGNDMFNWRHQRIIDQPAESDSILSNAINIGQCSISYCRMCLTVHWIYTS